MTSEKFICDLPINDRRLWRTPCQYLLGIVSTSTFSIDLANRWLLSVNDSLKQSKARYWNLTVMNEHFEGSHIWTTVRFFHNQLESRISSGFDKWTCFNAYSKKRTFYSQIFCKIYNDARRSCQSIGYNMYTNCKTTIHELYNPMQNVFKVGQRKFIALNA